MAQLPYADIAHILEKDEAAIRKMISRSRRKLRNFLRNECALFNPEGNCQCRMKRWVQDVNLPEEYQKLRKAVHRVNILRESEQILPRKNYWVTYLSQ
jgi:RNA polymerase sigma-70 factor (ECF subfamily)